MLEVLFSENAKGSMAIAMGKNTCACATSSVIITNIGGKKPTKKEIRAAQKEAEEREKRNWQDAVPLKGDRRDIFCFPLLLSVGEICEDGIGEQRKNAMLQLLRTDPHISEKEVEKWLETSRKNLAQFLERMAGGEPVRIWSSANPDDACGICWLMEQIRPMGFETCDITLVKLPDFEERADGVVQRYTSWGEIEPHEWGRMALLGKRLPAFLLHAMADRWKMLQAENAPLRAVINGQLVSAPDTLYDDFIKREIFAQAKEFMQAEVIGRVLGKYQLGISDSWVALRMEQMIQNKMLEPVTQAASKEPFYRRILRKCKNEQNDKK